MKQMMWLALMVAGSAQLQAPLYAQEVAVARVDVPVHSEMATQRPTGLDALITLSLQDTKLKTVLHAIARQAAIDVIFGDDVAKATKTVSLQVEKRPASEAITQALRGTDIGYVVTKSGKVMFSKQVERTAREEGVIVGRVVHAKTKQPVAGATVLLDDNTKGVVTGEDGTFRIAAPAGDRTIRVRLIGYTRTIQRVVVGDGASVNIEIVLEPSASVLDEVVVTGSVVATERKAIATPITVITADDIEKRGITRIEQLFRGEVPGVIALDEGSTRYSRELGAMQSAKVYARGASTPSGGANPLKTYVDGVEILDPAYLGTIDPQSIERVEIVTGPQAATIYGSGAMGGVMQIFTKKGTGAQNAEITTSLKYGMLESNLTSGLTPSHAHSMSIAGSTGPGFSYSVNLSYNYTGQWQPALFNRSYGGAVGATHTNGPFTVGGSVSITSGRNGTIDNSGYLLSKILMESGEYHQQYTTTSLWITKKVATSQSQILSFNLDYRPMSLWHHRLTIGRSGNNFGVIPIAPSYETPRDSLFQTRSSHGQRTTASYSTTMTPDPIGVFGNTITLGASGSWGKNVTILGCQASSASATMIGCISNGTVQVSTGLDDRSVGGFGQWRMSVFDRLYFTLGLRAERNPNYGDAHKIDWTPTNGVAYTIEYGDISVKLLGSYGRATRAPSADQKLQMTRTFNGYEPSTFVSRLANPDLRPERSRGPQGGMEIYYGNVGSISVNQYSQTVVDLIQSISHLDSTLLVNVSSGQSQWRYANQYQNVAKVKQDGWEAAASLHVGRVTAKAAYTWSDSKVLETQSSGYVRGQSFWGLPSHAFNIVASYAYGGSSVTLITNYIGKSLQRYIDDGDVFSEGRKARVGMYVAKKTDPDPWRGWVMPGYAKSDLVVSQRLSPSVSATMNITNLGDSYGNDVGQSRPSLGRQTLLGISVRFPRR